MKQVVPQMGIRKINLEKYVRITRFDAQLPASQDRFTQTPFFSHTSLFLYCAQVVKVVGSNISHKLRLSRVKPSDEGTYECRVIDFSDDAGVRHHRVRAYLQVVPESDILSSNQNNFQVLDDTKVGVGFIDGGDGESHSGTKGHVHSHHQNHGHHQEHSKRPSPPAHHSHGGGGGQQHKEGRELRKRDVDSSDCSDEPSCAL